MSCFTNRDLAKVLGLEMGDKIVVTEDSGVRVGYYEVCPWGVDDCYITNNKTGDDEIRMGLKHLISSTWHKVDEIPALTENEHTILRGRWLERYTYIGRDNLPDAIYFTDDERRVKFYSLVSKDNFKFIKSGEEYEIYVLLGGL